MAVRDLRSLMYVVLMCMSFLVLSSPCVHIFGDSHAYFCFSDNHTDNYTLLYEGLALSIAVHRLGPKTMFSIGKNGLDGLTIKNYGVNEKEIVVFTLGEIDVRCHIGKQRDMHHRHTDEIIDTLVTNYFRTINQNRVMYGHIVCVVMEVVPPSDQAFNPDYPRYGSIEDRIAITRALNKKLKAACVEHGALFLEINELYADHDGKLNSALSDGGVHVGMGHNYLVKQKLVKLLSGQL